MLANILAVGLMASVMSFSPRYIVDNQNDTITFSAEELNNNSYQSIYTALQNEEDLETLFQNVTTTYNTEIYTFEEMDGWNINFTNGIDYITYNTESGEDQYKFTRYVQGTGNVDFEYSMTINNAEWFIANIEEPPNLTLSKYDLNNKKYTYLAEQLNNATSLDLASTSITYNNVTYTFYTFENEDFIEYTNGDLAIRFSCNEIDPVSYGKWQYMDNYEGEYLDFDYPMTINNAQWFLDNINAPLDSEDMMTAITSGLPLMASLAQAFLNGFTSIFWNSTTSSLTTFSMFALIMLSVAIVFACIKLVLNVVRSNTGV